MAMLVCGQDKALIVLTSLHASLLKTKNYFLKIILEPLDGIEPTTYSFVYTLVFLYHFI